MDAEIADRELDSADAVEATKEESENFSATVDADDAEGGHFLMGKRW